MNTSATIEAPAAVAPTASPIVRYTPTEAGLAELRGRLAGVVYDVRTTNGMDEARKDRRECVTLRVALEAARTEEKADIVARGKLIDGEAKRIKEAIEALEAPIDQQIKAEEQRKEAEKAAKAAAAAEIQKRVDWIRTCAAGVTGKTAAEITTFAEQLAAIPIDAFGYGERAIEAQDERAGALVTLAGMAEAAGRQEAEALRLKAEREQLERDQAAARERQAAEDAARAARIAAEDAERAASAEAARTAEVARQDAIAQENRKRAEAIEAIEKAAREKREAEDAAAKAARDDADRQAEEARAAAQKVLDDQAAEIRRQQDEAAAVARAAAEAQAQAEREAAERIAEAQRAARAELEAAADTVQALRDILTVASDKGENNERARVFTLARARDCLEAVAGLKMIEAQQAQVRA